MHTKYFLSKMHQKFRRLLIIWVIVVNFVDKCSEYFWSLKSHLVINKSFASPKKSTTLWIQASPLLMTLPNITFNCRTAPPKIFHRDKNSCKNVRQKLSPLGPWVKYDFTNLWWTNMIYIKAHLPWTSYPTCMRLGL